jgi:hypothetical protein
MWWPLLAATALFLVCWGFASLLWRLVFGKPNRTPEPSLEDLCREERAIQERAQGFTFHHGDINCLRADARARW